MPQVGFKYCALRYLDLWLSNDRVYCDALQGSDEAQKLKALTSAAGFYRVARNLPEKYDAGKGYPRYKPVLDIIEAQESAAFQGTKLIDSILRVRDRISAQYGGRGVLSLTTKFLWLKFKTPIIIYDSQARKAVGVRAGAIEDYYSRWHQLYLTHEGSIEDACSSLPSVREYCVNPATATADYVAHISSQQWFRERVLDIYLWNDAGG